MKTGPQLVVRHRADESSRPEHEPEHFWLPLRKGNLLLMVAGCAVFVFFCGLGFDLFLIHQERMRPFAASMILNAAFAIAAALLAYNVLAHDREERVRILERLTIIDEMNHHIRNALQVISFNAHRGPTELGLGEINQAVNRIQWALQEVLPKVEPEFASFEGSARTEKLDGTGQSNDAE